MQARITGWKSKIINMVGRIALAKSTLNSKPFHVIQYIKLPHKVTSSIKKIQRNFIWENTIDKNKIHLSNWEKITGPKEGRLDIQKAELRNKAMHASLS